MRAYKVPVSGKIADIGDDMSFNAIRDWIAQHGGGPHTYIERLQGAFGEVWVDNNGLAKGMDLNPVASQLIADAIGYHDGLVGPAVFRLKKGYTLDETGIRRVRRNTRRRRYTRR